MGTEAEVADLHLERPGSDTGAGRRSQRKVAAAMSKDYVMDEARLLPPS